MRMATVMNLILLRFLISHHIPGTDMSMSERVLRHMVRSGGEEARTMYS